MRRYGKYLAVPTILGATTLLADGIITPPISVASAIEGLTIVEGLQDLPTVPIVIVILSVLFFFQRFGTQKVGGLWAYYGDLVWHAGHTGCYTMVHYPSVLQTIHPKYALDLLIKYPHGFWLLGAVFLATTGAEALYSDLGALWQEQHPDYLGLCQNLPAAPIILVNRPGCCTVQGNVPMVEIHFLKLCRNGSYP